MHWKSCLSVAIVASLGACKHLDVPESKAIAVLTVDSVTVQGDQYRTRALGVFLSEINRQVPNSRFVVDSCRTLPYPLETARDSGATIDAGSPVTITTDKESAAMLPASINGLTEYALQGDGRVAFTPGTPVTFSIPGAPNGFPQTSITGATAQPLEIGPVDPNPADNTGLVLTWNASADSTAVVISLEYGSTSDRTTADQQIVCSLTDDGVDTLSLVETLRWKQSPPVTRRVTAYRWRTTLQTVSDAALALMISQYDAPPKTTFP
jgi:hypothetical protein